MNDLTVLECAMLTTKFWFAVYKMKGKEILINIGFIF